MDTRKLDERRATIGPIVVGATIAAVIVWLFATALHDPRPHDLQVGLVAPEAVAAQVTAGLAERMPGAFAITSFGSAEEARQAVFDRAVAGAFVVGAGAPTILVAGGAGEAAAATIGGAFSGIAAGLGQQATVQDVRPLPTGDPHGVVPFFLVLGVLVSGLVYQMASYTLRGHAVLTPRGFGALVVFAIVDGAAAAIAVGSVVGFSSSLWLLAGVCALLVFAVVAATAACQRLFGIAGTALAAFVVILLGASSSGAMAGPEFLPDAFRALSPLLPPGAGLGLIRGALYFDGAGMAGPAIVLLAWIAVSLGVTYGADVWSHERRVAVASAAG